ncbi:MAG: SPOR domain-containing protein [Tannerella sp.]|jgi:hypothetical protein|nr:SPOR domain-containing protein [Tannerella sp.]
MERLVEHIEHLLLWHDCVIIPDFGGFVLQPVPAVYAGNEHLFTPARKEIVFNPTLTHNDGLLTESYMQGFSLDFNEARKHVGNDVAAMKENLDEDRQIQFGRIGLFIKEYERIIFVPSGNSDELFCTSSYGLPVFYFLSLAARRSAISHMDSTVGTAAADSRGEMQLSADTNTGKKPPKQDNVIYTIPVTHAFVRVLAAAVAAVILFFLISTPVGDVNKASYSASFVPREIMPRMSADEIVSNAFSAADAMLYTPAVSGEKASGVAMNGTADSRAGAGIVPEAKVTAPSVKREPDAIPDRSASTTSPAKSKSQPSAATSPAKQPSATATSSAVRGRYYVIIGSFNTRTQAQGYISRLKGDVAGSAGIITNDGKVRVYAQQFPGEAPALSYLNTIRRNQEHKQAWIYRGQ